MWQRTTRRLASAAAMALAAGTAAAEESALERALGAGASRLDAAEIAERFVGRTGTWVAASGDRTVRIFYGDDHRLVGRLVGGDWSGAGIYGVSSDDRLCVSWDGAEPDRLRCLHVLVVNGKVTKYDPTGGLNGHYERFAEGRALR